ncbi:oxidoreductase NAD-binding domain-containing protein [Xylariales sp. AK1849]|nr:oxidoreductase NAD-binding domain-containing protein [Xylariales sp. AK1849]
MMVLYGPEFTAKEVAAHKEATNAWMVIHGEVYDISKYLHDHPGGADVIIEAAGVDASEAFDNAGHSEDAFEIMANFRIGKLKGASKRAAPKPVKVTMASISKPTSPGRRNNMPKAVGSAVFALGALGIFFAPRLAGGSSFTILPATLIPKLGWVNAGDSAGLRLGFFEGFLIASGVFAIAGSVVSHRLLQLINFESGFMGCPPHMKLPKIIKAEPLLQRGWLHPTVYQNLLLVSKTMIAPNTYRFTFELPTPDTILGLPIGQHVTIATTIDGKAVSRSYTPVSNNADRGILELVIKCYPNGLLSGGYLANLDVGDEVEFRGPQGAMRYRPGLCKRIGMVAGGTGITPMYQLIRAICENERDTTEVSLIFANRTEADILLRDELEAMARRYPRNLKLFYLLDQPSANWSHGSGHVTREIMAQRLPAANPDTKMMICGPPAMLEAARDSLVSLGFQRPGAMSTMRDQIFCF